LGQSLNFQEIDLMKVKLKLNGIFLGENSIFDLGLTKSRLESQPFDFSIFFNWKWTRNCLKMTMQKKEMKNDTFWSKDEAPSQLETQISIFYLLMMRRLKIRCQQIQHNDLTFCMDIHVFNHILNCSMSIQLWSHVVITKIKLSTTWRAYDKTLSQLWQQPYYFGWTYFDICVSSFSDYSMFIYITWDCCPFIFGNYEIKLSIKFNIEERAWDFKIKGGNH